MPVITFFFIYLFTHQHIFVQQTIYLKILFLKILFSYFRGRICQKKYFVSDISSVFIFVKLSVLFIQYGYYRLVKSKINELKSIICYLNVQLIKITKLIRKTKFLPLFWHKIKSKISFFFSLIFDFISGHDEIFFNFFLYRVAKFPASFLEKIN